MILQPVSPTVAHDCPQLYEELVEVQFTSREVEA